MKNVENIINILEKLGAYALPAFMLLISVILFIYLIHKINNVKKLSKSEYTASGKNSIFAQTIIDSDERAYVLIRKNDLYPLYVTKNIESYLGVSIEKIKEDITNILSPLNEYDAGIFKKNFDQWTGDKPFATTFFNTKSEKWLEIRLTNGSLRDYFLIAVSDATERMETIADINKKLDEAEKASLSKTEFLSKMSHDIRTPMNGIIGIIALMKLNIKQDERLMQYVEKMESLSQFLIGLINDILDISRIEAGKIQLAEDPFNLYDFAEKLNSMFRKTVEEKNVKFEIELLDIENPNVIGDEFRISQIIINFISNAIKFTDSGEIQIKIRQINISNGIASLMFRVRDTGKGIDPLFINDLFRPFEQEDAKIARKYGGSGLGMAIADQMAHLMNGEIVVDSMPGKGSDFTVYISLPVADEDVVRIVKKETSAAANKDFTWNGVTILMAEDNEINAEITVEMLQMEGASVDVASDGEKVITMFYEKPKGYYDVILMDVQMPIRNGWDAAKLIRGMKDKGGDVIPIFALSADAFVEDKRHSIEVGMNGHLSKPIDYDNLKEAVGAALRK